MIGEKADTIINLQGRKPVTLKVTSKKECL